MKGLRYLLYAAVAFALRGSALTAPAQVSAVAAVGMTVGDMDRAVAFYSALTFHKISEVEVFGDDYERLVGIFGARLRVVRMQLGQEFIELV
jgi:hypothetical protein